MVDCLAVLGASEADVQMQRGRAWLLDLECRNGEKGRWSDTSAAFYRHYHTSWCGVVGLMPRRVLGEGPCCACAYWQDIAEASAYWANTADLVQASPAGLLLEGTPPWNSPLTMEASSSCSGSGCLNLGIMATGQKDRVFDRLRDRSLLGCALGMHSGHIPDSAITSSSMSVDTLCQGLQGSSCCWPFYGRLDKDLGCAGAWVPAQSSGKEWLQIDLGSPVLLTGTSHLSCETFGGRGGGGGSRAPS